MSNTYINKYSSNGTTNQCALILSDSNRFERTSMQVKGAVVYRDKETGWYYQRDTFHKGAAAEIEVYGPDGNHRGTITPDGKNKGGPVPGRRLPK